MLLDVVEGTSSGSLVITFPFCDLGGGNTCPKFGKGVNFAEKG